MMMHAPIALFTFKRPEHTRRTLESLAQNPEFVESPVFIYCDGARNAAESVQVEETRKLVRDWPHPNKTIVERDRNWGLAKSVIEGVTQLCSEYGRVIVVEDDLVVSPVLLNYLNAALDRYADEPKVMQVSAHMFPVEIESDCDAVMLPFTTSWGWATWSRAWKCFDPAMTGYENLRSKRALRWQFDMDGSYPSFRMLKQQKYGKIHSWAIRWYLSVFTAKGLVLFPKQTLVRNEGFDGSGTNCKTPQVRNEILGCTSVNKFPSVQVDDRAFAQVKHHLRKEQFILSKLIKYMGAKWANFRL